MTSLFLPLAEGGSDQITTLDQLATVFRQNAGQGGVISFDDTFLSSSVLTTLIDALMLPSDTTAITLESVDPANITFSDDGNTLYVVGAVFSQTVVGVDSAPAMAAIQLDAGSNFQVILNIGLPSDWTFGTSFPSLAGLQLPDQLAFDSGPCLYVSTYGPNLKEAIPTFPPPQGGSAPTTCTGTGTPLAQGLNYYAGIGPGGIYKQIAGLLTNSGIGPFFVSGTIDPTVPEFDLHAPVNTVPSVSIGFITASATPPWLGITGGDDALAYYLGTKLNLQSQAGGSLSFEFDVTLPTGSATDFTLTLKSGSSTPLSLGNLAQVLFNQSADSLTNHVPPPLQYLLTAVGSIQLNYLNATFSLPSESSSATIQTVKGEIGTSTWAPPLPGLPTLTMTLDWTLDFKESQTDPAWNVVFTAEMDFSKNLSFNVEIAGGTGQDLTITGTEKGSVSLGLSDLNSLLPTGIQIPDSVANLTFTNFSIVADTGKSTYTISGELSASLNLFGLQLLAIPDMKVGLTLDNSGESAQYTFNFEGSILLGSLELATTGVISNVEGTDTVFTMHLVNQTIGSMLNSLVQLVDPGFSISFPAPWDAFLNISLDALVLTIDVTKGTVSLTYTAEINLFFIDIHSITLTYTKAQTEGKTVTASNVSVSLDYNFIGEDTTTTTFDAMNDTPPTPPAGKPPVFDLVYAGLGQHIALPPPQPSTIADVMTALINSVVPVQPGQLPAFGGDSISFAADSNWLIGAQFSVMGTVSIAAIFNDPNLYGVRLALSGENAKSFDGLSFEILYRKVTDSIGVYHIALTLPVAMRTIELGEVSVTLPSVILDIYTNGNFRVDFGFPNGLDFSNSFCVQVFPFVGYGGFYFALLDGSTSSKVPVITNGTFSPVIEFGIALSIGVGKTVDEGILSGGISVTVVGILQGVIAWFVPSNNSSKSLYYWFQGTIAITGKLYATIDFGIIQASLNVTAYASVTLTIESYQPIYIAINAGVSVEVSVKIVFFTIHFSFSATVSASFTIGSASPTPWVLASSGGGSQQQLARTPQALHAARRLTMLTRPALARACSRAAAISAAPESLLNWPPVPLPGGAQTVTLYALAGFSKMPGAPQSNGVDTEVNAVFMLTAPNSVPPDATNNAQRNLLTANAATQPFNLLMQAMLSWGIYAITNPNPTKPPYVMPTSVTAQALNQLQSLLKDPDTINAAFDYAGTNPPGNPNGALTNFLGTNFIFNVSTIESVNSQQGVAVFPVVPAITLSDNGAITTPINFSTPTVDSAYADQVKAYFAKLQVQFQQQQSQQSTAALAADTPTLSIAEIVYSQYFNMLMSSSVKAAIDLLAKYPYTTPASTAGISIATIGTNIADTTLATEPIRAITLNQTLPVLQTGTSLIFKGVTHTIRAGETLANIVLAYQTMGAIVPEPPPLNVPYDPITLLGANLGTAGVFNPSVTVAIAGISYTTQASDTPSLICARFLVLGGMPGSLNSLTGVPALASQLLSLNSGIGSVTAPIDAATTITLPSGSYTSVAGDTLTLIAGYLLEMQQQPGAVAAMVAALQALNPNPQPVLNIPPVSTTLTAAASIDSVAASLLTTTGNVIANLAALRAVIFSGITPPAGPISYLTNAGDTLNMIGARLLIQNGGQTAINALTGLAAQVANLQTANPSITDATAQLAPGTSITLPSSQTYISVTGDTLTLIAAYTLEIVQQATALNLFVAGLLLINPGLKQTDPTQPQPTGTPLTLPAIPMPPAGSNAYTTSITDTLNIIGARLLIQNGGQAAINALTGLSTQVTTLQGLNSGYGPTTPIPAGTAINLPASQTYTSVAGDTLTLIAAYTLVIAQDPTDMALFLAAMIMVNPGLQQADPTKPQINPAKPQEGVTLTLPTIATLLAANGVLDVPVSYAIQNNDTFSRIATKFNLALKDIANAAGSTANNTPMPAVFAGGQSLTISNVSGATLDSTNPNNLFTVLLNQGAFNNASGMVSRFMLSGLRLPDPETDLSSLTLGGAETLASLAAIQTQAMYVLTQQQYVIASPPATNYAITLANNTSPAVNWLQLNGQANPISFGLTTQQLSEISTLAGETFNPAAQTMTRLSLFQMSPPRVALQQDITWQAAVLPSQLSSSGSGSPGIWLFPDSLVLQFESLSSLPSQEDLLYQVVLANHAAEDAPVNAAPAQQYCWGTIVDFTISKPTTDGPAASVNNTYVIGGADDTGNEILQSMLQYLSAGADTATLYLLYSTSSTGLTSDPVNQSATYILKTNLSTLTNPLAAAAAPEAMLQLAPTTGAYSAGMSDASEFLRLLWEAGITRSGGYYLNYFNGTAALPATVFAGGSTATISVLILLNSQLPLNAPVQPFNNCAVVADHVDPTVTNVFVQPSIYVVQPPATGAVPPNSLQGVATGIQTEYGVTLSVVQIAQLNQSVPLLLEVGQTLTVNGQSYTVKYGDTFLSIAGSPGNVAAIATANATASALSPGSPVQLALGVLTASTTVPPGTAGFEITMTNAETTNDAAGQLFNMVGYSIAGANGFTASGQGLPTTPSLSPVLAANGLSTNPPGGSETDPYWYYTQAMAVAPFGSPQNGSLSAALPPAAQNPYNGILTTPGVCNTVQIDVNLQDIYGNQWPFPQGQTSVQNVYFGYYDPIVSLGSWPSLGISYSVMANLAGAPVMTLDMSMQQVRYIPAPGVAAKSAVDSVAADLQSYTTIYYQLAQDLTFTLQTSLDNTTAAYPLSTLPFAAFARGAYIYLSTLQTMGAYVFSLPSGANVPVSSLLLFEAADPQSAQFGITGAQLFTVNQNSLVTDIFGTKNPSPLVVPQMYVTKSTDTIASIIAGPGTQLSQFLQWNANVPLANGADLLVARPNLAATANDSLSSLCTRNHCSVVTLLTANLQTTGILRKGVTYTVGSNSYTTNDTDTFGNIANKLVVAPASLATACQFLTGIFLPQASIPATDIQANANDSLQALAGFLNTTVALVVQNKTGDNTTLVGIFATATAVQVGTVANPELESTDTLQTFAQRNNATVAQLGNANVDAQIVAGPNANLQIPGALNQPSASSYATYTASSDTLAGIAARFSQTPLQIATANQTTAGLLVPGQPVTAQGTNPNNQPAVATVLTGASPTFSNIIAQFAALTPAITVQLSDLAAAVAWQTGLVQPTGVWATGGPTYTAGNDTLGSIATKFNQQPVLIATLNQDIPGLLLSGQPVAIQGKTITTAANATFNSIIAQFAQQGVTVQLSDVATAVQSQTGLVQPGGLWIATVMLGSQAFGGTLAGLAAAYNTDPFTIGVANAACPGFLNSGQNVSLWSVSYTTSVDETLNSLVNRVNASGFTLSENDTQVAVAVSDIVGQIATVPNLVNTSALVAPIPPPNPPASPSPLANCVTITPHLASAVIELAVNVTSARTAAWVDPDFKNSPAVLSSTYQVPPNPNPQTGGAPFSLTNFAETLRAAIPNVFVATGAAPAEGDPTSSGTLWAVNLGNTDVGPTIQYQFEGANTQYFSMPPLSTSLLGGPVGIRSYESGVGLAPPPPPSLPTTNFQAVDLDGWMNTFLTTVDLFLTPAYASGAFAVDPDDVNTIIGCKQTIADQMSQRVTYVLNDQLTAQPPQGSSSDAITAMQQAMLTQLAQAYSIDTLVQVPVTINDGWSDAPTAPRLSGKLNLSQSRNQASAAQTPDSYSFSTAKVSTATPNPPTVPDPTATFLFSVKNPAENQEVVLSLQYVVSDLEIPDPSSMFEGYEGSYWLKFVEPISNANSQIGTVNIPVPLRSYPSPVLLLSQTAIQSVAQPQSPADLTNWNLDFTYTHDDVEQDMPMAVMTFNPNGGSKSSLNNVDPVTDQIFRALAQFTAVYPQLKQDLALLPTAPPPSNAVATCAVQAFSEIVQGVADAFTPPPVAALQGGLNPIIYAYTFQKGIQSGVLQNLSLTSVDPATGQAAENPTSIWPTLVATPQGGASQTLLPQTISTTQVQYTYNPPIDATLLVQQQFYFNTQPPVSGLTISPSSVTAGQQVTISITLSAPAPAGGAVIDLAASNIAVPVPATYTIPAGQATGSVTVNTTATTTTITSVTASYSGGSQTANVTVTVSGTPQPPAPSASANSGTQLFFFGNQNIFLEQSGIAGISITRNLNLIGTAQDPNYTNPAFVYQTPLTNFNSVAVPYIFASNDMSVGAGSPTQQGVLAQQLGAFLQKLLASPPDNWTAGDTIDIRFGAAYSYALATDSADSTPELGALVPITFIPDYTFYLAATTGPQAHPADWDATNPNSFVSQLDSLIYQWFKTNTPVVTNGYYVFDLTIYAAVGDFQPLVRASSLRYQLQ